MSRIEAHDSKSGWSIAVLAGLTTLFAGGMPFMCMPVLFPEIALDLDLTLPQVGAAWGMGGLAGMVMSPFGGIIGDRFGIRKTLMTTCILGGLIGAVRGLSSGFFLLSLSMFLFIALQNTIILNVHKSTGVFYSGKKMVIANGIVAAGAGSGMMLSAMISDTIMSPLLGGWRNVLIAYGAVSIVIGFIWSSIKENPARGDEAHIVGPPPFRRSISQIVTNKNAWLFGLANLCYSGSLIAFSGYLPLHLRSIGWLPASADGALAALSASGMLAAIPLAILSSRLGLRKSYVIAATLLSMTCVFFMTLYDNFAIWPLVILFGLVRDGFYAVIFTMAIETKGIGPTYAGTAIGLIFAFGGLGSFIASPVGNSLAVINPDYAFYFWATMHGVAALIFCFINTGRGK